MDPVVARRAVVERRAISRVASGRVRNAVEIGVKLWLRESAGPAWYCGESVRRWFRRQFLLSL